MSLVSAVVTSLAVILGIVVAYCLVCLGLLFYGTPRDDPPYGYVIDVIFIVTAPFVLAVVFLTGLRQSEPVEQS